MRTVTIWGTLALNGDGNSTINFILKTLNIIVTPIKVLLHNGQIITSKIMK